MTNKNMRHIEKNISPFYYKKPSKVEFRDILYTVQKTKTLPIEHLEKCHVWDANRYKKEELAKKILNFVKTFSYVAL